MNAIAMSVPAVTPDDVQMFPSTTHLAWAIHSMFLELVAYMPIIKSHVHIIVMEAPSPQLI
jgi:hypothetical protein